MREALATTALAALLLAGCQPTDCELLGDRLCRCAPAGVSHASCVQGVKTEVQRVNPGGHAQHECKLALDTCWPPSQDAAGNAIDPPITFCDWISSRCGKAACHMSGEDYATLQGTLVDPANPDLGYVCLP
jgi:hypothetical protein